MYREVPARVDSVAAMEAQVIDFWRDHEVFHRSLAQRANGPQWNFYEGPPTANGSPGTHHVEARVFKDVFPRHRTMKGYHVPRRAGWDCHGLPVELAVEKELGFNGKQDIERYGVVQFNERCRESVHRHVEAFHVMTERMGYWVDFDDAYWTMDPAYIESVWWSLKEIFAKGLLVQDHRVSPYCPRCGTGLSDHEIAQGYEDVVDPSVFVRFPLVSGPLLDRHPGLQLLVWTTTPWTLVSNTAVAFQPQAQYAVARSGAETFVVAADLVHAVLGDDVTVLEHVAGPELEMHRYRPPFTLVDVPDAHVVVPADYVTVDDGTGLVHIAPAFGAEDLAVGRANDLPLVNPIGSDGYFRPHVPLVGGVFFKKADEALVADLEARALLFRHVPFEHAYPHCWRCHTPLIYYAQPSWFIRTTAQKDELLAQNEATDWFPRTIQWGRYGDWLRNNIDWALSRDRYWGTPLPIWRCPDDHLTAVGSLAELSDLAGRDVSGLDPHRPFVDDVTITCPQCSATATRVPEVIDCWYDSGAMPFAQFGYPHAGVAEFEASYPADFICEAIDQTRGWFYTLMAVGTLVFDQNSYRNVLVLGLILDEDGRKMSKHLGNVLDPIQLMDDHGADAVRWFMLASGSPWQSRRVGHQAIEDVWRKTLSTYWSTVSFQALYARASDWDPATVAESAPSEHVLDRWALSRAHRLVSTVDEQLEQFDSQGAGRELAGYIDDLSNWYVRRSRRRFWDGDPQALTTLHECLRLLTLAMAPFTPFITERVWRDLFATATDDSVHLQDWPAPNAALLDDAVEQQMALVRRLVDLGRTARGESSVGTRQPLAAALVAAPGWAQLPGDLRDLLADELNTLQLHTLAEAAGDLVQITVKPNFRALGQRYGKQTPAVARAIAALDPADLVNQVRGSQAGASVPVDGVGPVDLTEADLVITETPREGWAVASQDGATVALDLHLTPELVRMGIARQLIRTVAEARKASGFDVSDRIRLTWSSPDEQVRDAVAEHVATIADEVLATSVAEGGGDGAGATEGVGYAPKDESFRVWVVRAG